MCHLDERLAGDLGALPGLVAQLFEDQALRGVDPCAEGPGGKLEGRKATANPDPGARDVRASALIRVFQCVAVWDGRSDGRKGEGWDERASRIICEFRT